MCMENKILSITKMDKQNRITIPIEARKFLGVKSGQKIIVYNIDNEIILKKA